MEKSLFNRSGQYILSTLFPETYDNSSEINGYAVVINNYDFGGIKETLLGRENDSKKLQDTFSGLNFDVKIYENKPKDEMLSIFKDYGDKDHSKFNMFACVLSSHGSDESICGSDGRSVVLVELVRSIINCKSLEGKPKLFFVDAGRTYSKNSKLVELRMNTDNLFCYSTLEGKSALTVDNSKQFTGSVFCRVLCDTLKKYGKKKALCDILQHLKLCMNKEHSSEKVETLDTLNKILWFISKNHEDDYTWTVAVDFGTSMSGFAYSTREEFHNSPLFIFHKQCWNEESKNRNTMKTASCLLLDSNKELVAFGFDAQATFARLQLEGKHTQYYYFHNFKMAVYNQQKSLKGLELKDIQNKCVAARDVFVESIKAIRQEVLKTLIIEYNDVNAKKIRWVLTVPAIWPDDAKLFMRECAQEAKLPWEQVLIALEPEAASIYCQFLAINKGRNLSDGFRITDIGTKYMILDVGGGTTDITVHEKEKNGQLKELKKASGRNIGSSYINEKIMEIFEDIFGKTFIDKLKTEKPNVYLDLCWEIEAIKKTVTPETQNEVKITFSYLAFNTLSLREQNQTIDDVITRYNKSASTMKVQLKDDKLVIQTEHLIKHFRCLVGLIVEEAKTAIESIDVSLIVLVGGLADCKFLTEKMKACFPRKRIVSPEDANLAVLKGAVLYGHNPTFIDPRVTKFTYGIEVLGRFNDKQHDRSRRQKDGWGNYCCKNAFDLIICQNKNMPLGKIIKKRYGTSFPNQENVSFNVFTSNIDSPLYTDDGSCRKIGMLSIVIPNPSKSMRFVDVQYIFGDTEFKVKATEQNFRGQQERIFFLG